MFPAKEIPVQKRNITMKSEPTLTHFFICCLLQITRLINGIETKLTSPLSYTGFTYVEVDGHRKKKKF
jgi:hypothetical protein